MIMKRPGNLGNINFFAGCGKPKHHHKARHGRKRLTLGGFSGPLSTPGQTEIENIDDNIAQVEAQIKGLQRIIQVGSHEGKALAQQKLNVAEKVLKDWYSKRVAARGRA